MEELICKIYSEHIGYSILVSNYTKALKSLCYLLSESYLLKNHFYKCFDMAEDFRDDEYEHDIENICFGAVKLQNKYAKFVNSSCCLTADYMVRKHYIFSYFSL